MDLQHVATLDAARAYVGVLRDARTAETAPDAVEFLREFMHTAVDEYDEDDLASLAESVILRQEAWLFRISDD